MSLIRVIEELKNNMSLGLKDKNVLLTNITLRVER